ncbi:MAG TPA: YegP family protein [Pricia sp.]|nr:YegP family protein [Pricia sp.]
MIQIHSDNEGSFRFSLRTENGDTLLNSVPFSDKHEMDKSFRKLETMSLTRNQFERKTNTEGKFLFRLKDNDGRAIGHSEPYDSEAGMENGIKNFREQIRSLL